MKETEAGAVKLEGGKEILESVDRILSAGIPVMGHLGLTPQSIHKYGTYAVRAKEEPKQKNCSKMPTCWKRPAVYGIVLEKIPAHLAGQVRPRTRHPDNRHRCRSVRGRTGTRDTRHARHQQRILSAVSATLCEPDRNDVRCIRQLHPRRQGGRLPRRRGAVLTVA